MVEIFVAALGGTWFLIFVIFMLIRRENSGN